MNPQKENGYTAIANEIMEALSKYRIPGEQMQCLLFILRKTYGYNKKTDAISLSQFVKSTGIKRSGVARAIKGLIAKNLIYVKKGGLKKETISISQYRFNKRYKSWLSSLKKETGSLNIDKKVVSKKRHTKDIITKDKEIYSRVVIYLNKKTGKNFSPTTKETKKLIDARIRERFKPEDFKKVIDNKVYDFEQDKFEHKYLRPQTLFGTKFESYLNQISKPINGGTPHKTKTLAQREAEEKELFANK